MSKIGCKVLISQDCRDGGKATGMTGVYEGDFPVSVTFGRRLTKDGPIEWRGEFDYNSFIDGSMKAEDETPLNKIFALWEMGKECPLPDFAMITNNPRIKLDDGDVIWGYECWWGEADKVDSLEDAQAQTEEIKELFRTAFEALRCDKDG